jgi:hypothetical protein
VTGGQGFAEGEASPYKNLLFRFPFLYITPCTRKGGIERSLSAQAGRSFFYPQRRKSAEKGRKHRKLRQHVAALTLYCSKCSKKGTFYGQKARKTTRI